MTTSGETTYPPGQDFIADPFPTLARMRAKAPVSLLRTEKGLPLWMVTRYDEVRAALADPRIGQDAVRAQALADSRTSGVYLGADISHMLNSDPPAHTRLRQAVQGAFTPGRVAALRSAIIGIADDLLDRLDGEREADLVGDFAFPLPITVICTLLGVPVEDRSMFRGWSTALLTRGAPGEEARVFTEMAAYLTGLLSARRAAPADDMLTDLLRAGDAGRLTAGELVPMAILLLIAGHETTVNLISTAILGLLTHPDQLAWLRADPGKMPTAIEEFLRFNPPVSAATLRFTTAPVRLGTTDIPQAEFVLLSLAAANHDPRRFAEPDRLILSRGDRGHLAFGHGIHRCLGSVLARLEGEVALSRLLARCPALELAAPVRELRWRNTSMLRGLEALPVRL